MVLFPAIPDIYPDIHCKKITAHFNSLSRYRKEVPAVDMNIPDVKGAFFLCFVNRCGSNFLAQALSSDRRLVQPGEVLNHTNVINKSKKKGFVSFNEYFCWLANTNRGKEGVFGCKASVGQLLYLYNEGILNQFKEEPKFIHIKRKDVLAQAVSLHIAWNTNQWTSTQPKNDVPIAYDREALLNIVKYVCTQNAIFESIFQLLGISPYVVYYETLVDRPRGVVRKVGDFLGIEKLTYVREKMAYKKQADQRNKEFISRLRQDFKLQFPKLQSS